MIVSMIDVDDLIRRRACVMGRCALPWALGRRPVVLGGMTVCPHLMEAAGLAFASAYRSSKLPAAASSAPAAHSASFPSARGKGRHGAGTISRTIRPPLAGDVRISLWYSG